MLVLCKVAIATIVLVSTGTAGTILWLDITGIPSCRDLSTDNNSDTYKGKYAEHYSKYFVGVSGRSNNNRWWEWVFNNKYQTTNQDDIKQNFKGKKSGSELKEVCKSAYQALSSNIKDEASSEGEYSEKDIWTFCSIGGSKPTSVSEKEKSNYSSGTYGNDETMNKLLISITDENNNWFWNIKEKERIESLETNSSSKFKTKIGNGGLESTLFINSGRVKEICKEAYQKTKNSETDKFPETDIYKFCTLKGSKDAA